MSELWADAPRYLQLFKEYMIATTGLSRDALHIYAGLLLFLGVRIIWRRRGGWVLGWLVALAMALAVEWLDMRSEYLERNLRPEAEHWHDIWNTMFWPSVLLLLGPWLQPIAKPKLEPSGDLADQTFHDSGEQPTPV
jgi:hypothetical protein